MANREDKNNIKDERIEDTTMYGEFVSSFDGWVSIDKQKKDARHLEKISEKKSHTTPNGAEDQGNNKKN